MNIQVIKQEVLNLPLEDRAQLAEALLFSLDALSDAEIGRLCAAEAQRRATEIDRGVVQPITAEGMERIIQAILK